MTLKMFPKQIVLLVLLATLSSAMDFMTPHVLFYKDGGFEVSIASDPLIHSFAFHGKKNKALDTLEAGTWNGVVKNATGDRMVFREANSMWYIGDQLHFWIHVEYDGQGLDIVDQVAEVKSE